MKARLMKQLQMLQSRSKPQCQESEAVIPEKIRNPEETRDEYLFRLIDCGLRHVDINCQCHLMKIEFLFYFRTLLQYNIV